MCPGNSNKDQSQHTIEQISPQIDNSPQEVILNLDDNNTLVLDNEFGNDKEFEYNMVKTSEEVEFNDKKTFIFNNCSFNNITFQ